MIELAFVVGLIWALSRGLDTTRTAIRSHTAAARKKTPDPHKRRAARQALAGWWLGETLHAFPHTRHGVMAGWENHRQAWREHQAGTAGRRADHAIRWAEIRAEIAAHIRRMDVAAASMSPSASRSNARPGWGSRPAALARRYAASAAANSPRSRCSSPSW